MTLEIFALILMLAVGLILFYSIIAIHDIPYVIAKRRNHPHAHVIHYAGWVSMFTLHSIWPFLWIWATMYDKENGYGFTFADDTSAKEAAVLENRLSKLEKKIDALGADQKLKGE